MFNIIGTGKRTLNAFLRNPDADIRGWWGTALSVLGDERAQDLATIRGSGRLNVLPKTFLLSWDFESFAAEFKGGIAEVYKQPLYSFETYDTAGHTQLTLFKPASTATKAKSNLLTSGQMNGGEAHVVLSIRIIPLPVKADAFVTAGIAPAFSEWYDILTGGTTGCWAELWILEKQYAVINPLIGAPAGMGFGSLFSSTATSSVGSASVVNNGHPSNMALYKTDPVIVILPNRNFRLELNWPTAKTTTADGMIGAWLDGYRIRAAQ